MKIYKILIIGLIILTSFSLIFNYPGFATFDIFTKFFSDLPSKNGLNIMMTETMFRYSPGLTALFTILMQLFPPDANIYFFYHQHAWVAAKLFLFASYFLTFLSIIFFVKSLKNPIKVNNIDIALAYFLSIALLLTNLALGFFNLLIAPVLIISLAYLIRKKFILALSFYLLSLSFNWTLFIFAPFFLFFAISQNKVTISSKVLQYLSFLLVFVFTILAYLDNFVFLKTFFSERSSQGIGMSWIANEALSYLRHYDRMSSGELFLASLPVLFVCGIIIYLGGFLLKEVLLKGWQLKKSLAVILTLMLMMLSSLFLDVMQVFTAIFLLIYLLLYIKFRSLKESMSVSSLLNYSLSSYFAFVLFFPSIAVGNLGWLVILGLLVFILQPVGINKLKLILINALVFVLLFTVFGIIGQTPTPREGYLVYFSLFKILFASLFIFFGFRQIFSTLTVKFDTEKELTLLKCLLVGFVFFFYISIVPFSGVTDVAYFGWWNKVLINYQDPFYAHTMIDNTYPPPLNHHLHSLHPPLGLSGWF